MDEPTLVVIRDWLNAEDRTNFERKYQVNFWACTQVMDSYAEKHSNSYPMTIGKDWTEKQKAQMALFLVGFLFLSIDMVDALTEILNDVTGRPAHG